MLLNRYTDTLNIETVAKKEKEFRRKLFLKENKLYGVIMVRSLV